jgi:hypothetical protein
VSELNFDRPWFEKVNVKALGDDVRRRILEKRCFTQLPIRN